MHITPCFKPLVWTEFNILTNDRLYTQVQQMTLYVNTMAIIIIISTVY